MLDILARIAQREPTSHRIVVTEQRGGERRVDYRHRVVLFNLLGGKPAPVAQAEPIHVAIIQIDRREVGLRACFAVGNIAA